MERGKCTGWCSASRKRGAAVEMWQGETAAKLGRRSLGLMTRLGLGLYIGVLG